MAAPKRSPEKPDSSGLRAVLLDAGGTLIHMPTSREEILQRLCRDLGLSITLEQAAAASLASERYYVRNYLGYDGDQGEFWRRYHGEALMHLGIEDPTGEKAAYISYGFGAAELWSPFEDAPDVCSRLRSMGLSLGVVSNAPTSLTDWLARTGLLPLFDTVVISQAVGIEKPDPRIFQMALQRLGVPPEGALFVGDLYEVDVLGARAAGITGILIDRNGTNEARDCPVIRGLDELIPLVKG